MIGGMKYLLFRVVAITAVVAVPIGAQSPSPVGGDQARWWAHVKTLADDSLEGRQTGTDGYRKAASYVAEQFERGRPETRGHPRIPADGSVHAPADRRGAVPCRARAWWPRGKEDVLRLGEDVTISLRAELAPSVDAPMVFAGYGLSAPDAGHDDLAGLDLKGKIVVFINGTPAEHHRRGGGTLSECGRPLAGAQGRWRDRRSRHPQPEDDGAAVGADGAEPPESGDDARRPALQRPGGNEVQRQRQPGERRTTVRGIRSCVRRPDRACRRAKAAAEVCAGGGAARPRHARIDADRIGQRGRAATGQRSRRWPASTSS